MFVTDDSIFVELCERPGFNLIDSVEQVTQGVPRIKEIINGSKKISTPIMDVALEVNDSPIFARLVKGRLEKTTLGQVAIHIRTVLRPGVLSATHRFTLKSVYSFP